MRSMANVFVTHVPLGWLFLISHRPYPLNCAAYIHVHVLMCILCMSGPYPPYFKKCQKHTHNKKAWIKRAWNVCKCAFSAVYAITPIFNEKVIQILKLHVTYMYPNTICSYACTATKVHVHVVLRNEQIHVHVYMSCSNTHTYVHTW